MPQSHDPTSSERSRAARTRTLALDAVVRTLLQLEQRTVAAYLERSSSPRLAAVDVRLQRLYGVARRAGAVPIYLRQRLAVLQGACAGEIASVAGWGRSHDLRAVLRTLFDDAPAQRVVGERNLAWLLGTWRRPGELDLLLASTTPLLAGAFRRRGFVLIPAAVQLAATLETLREVRARPSNSVQSDLLRVARGGYRLVPWPYSTERARLFQERYLEPYAWARFADDANVPSLERVERAYRAGLGLAVLAPGRDLPDLLCIASERAGTLHLLRLGVRDGDQALLRRGAVAALYALVPGFAEARGLHTVHVGNSRPWLGQGVLGYKWKWGYRPLRNAAQTLEWAVKIVRSDSAIARRLVARRPIVRTARGLAPASARDLLPVDGREE